MTIRVDADAVGRWKVAAGREKLNLSEWIRAVCERWATGSPEKVFGNLQKISEAEVEVDAASFAAPSEQRVVEAVKRSRLPKAVPVRRRHINLREDAQEEKPPDKVRCSYLWPSQSKKCPRCQKVHSDV